MSALTNVEVLKEMEQGSAEWLSLRTSKITSSDAAVIMGVSPWKNINQLYEEKVTQEIKKFVNDRMKRGTDLEPIARDLFSIQNGIDMFPRVVIRDWAMTSLDGMSECGKYILEIKCPGEKDHALALAGKIPEYYIPQLQHHMFVTGLDFIYYYSFDGADGVTLVVKRDDKYIEKMMEEEKKFYDCIMNKTPPEDSYVFRDDYLWNQCACDWMSVTKQIKSLEKQEEDLRTQLLFLCGQVNTKGGGISLCKVERKGNVDYSKIPELKNLDLDKYRKASSSSWRINCI